MVFGRVGIFSFLQNRVPCLQLSQLEQSMLKTPGEELREQFMKVQVLEENHNDDDYISRLKQLGVQPHPSIYPATFELKNGLKYPGMATNTQIVNEEPLVRVPEKLVLSSMKAVAEPHLVDVFCEDFYNNQECWEDRVLLTYCLYLCSVQAQDNIFYHMVQHMSKDIDILCFWSEAEIDLFRDKTIRKAATLDLESFEDEWKQFSVVREKYPILQGPSFDKQNYRWIFTHIVSRCFGSSIDFTSFVPFCEFFNHHASSVYYKVNTPKKPEQEDGQSSEISSSGSFNSDQYIEEGEFDYQSVEVTPYLWEGKQCFKLDKKQKKEIVQLTKQLLGKVETDLDLTDFTILFAGRFIEKVNIVKNEYHQGRKNYQCSLNALNDLNKILQQYVEMITKMYRKKHGKKYVYKKIKQEKPKTEFMRPDPQNYTPPYSEFMFATDKRDHFDPHEQVYFCYGRNSNRTLLLRYGFAIEGNKYDHVWFSYDLGQFLQSMPDLFQKVKELGLSLRRKFRINHTRLNLELIMFHRLLDWSLYSIRSLNEIFYVTNINRELSILKSIKETFANKLKNIEGDDDLTDPTLNYHEYFIAVYHIEQARILKKQISLIGKLELVLKKLEKGVSRQKAEEQLLSDSEKYILRHYLDTVA